MRHDMETPAQRLQKYLKELFGKFLKTPFAIPAAIAISAGVYVLVLIYAGSFCLGNLITPLVMLGVFWQFGLKSVKKLLIVGAVTCLALSGVWNVYAVDYYQHIDQQTGSNDNRTLVDGLVTPVFGGKTTEFNFTITVAVNITTSTVANVTVLMADLNVVGSRAHNYTMILAQDTSTNTSRHYYYVVNVDKPVNIFIFGAKIDGEWEFAFNQNPQRGSPVPVSYMEGPVYKDTGAVSVQLLALSFYASFVIVFPIYALLLLMVWWTRRARRMRVEAFEKAVAEREKETKGFPKEETKVSLSKAMGMESGGGFVCSECGADVPADAKVCPKCGEKFD